MTHLLAGTFSYCHRLSSVTIPKLVRFIGGHCFADCTALTTVAFEAPATIQRIESGAFSDCSSLASFTVPSSVFTLGASAFYECSELESVTFDTPSQLTNIPDGIFTKCNRLTSLTLPDSVTSLTPSAIRSSAVTSIIGSHWTKIAGLLVRLGKVFYCWVSPPSLRIPDSVREIGDGASDGVSTIKDLSFEEGTVRIGVSAFLCCRKLEKAAFPASLTVIDAEAFCGCVNLRQITFAVGSQ
jgi:hypothetical protein